MCWDLGECCHILHVGQRLYNGRQNNGPLKEVHVLIPGTCQYITWHGKGELRRQMEFRLLISLPFHRWVILDYPNGPHAVTRALNVWEVAEGEPERGQSEDWPGVAWLWDGGRGPETKGCRRPLEAGKGQETASPQSLQISKIINLCPFNPPNLW